MTKALRIRHGLFGRVAVLEMDRRLVVHAHPQAHLLFKVAGSDSAFGVHDRRLPLSAEWAVAVNPWEPHCYPRSPGAAPSLILALHIDPSWLAARLDGFAWPQCFPCHGVRMSPGLRGLVTIDWTLRENVRANLRRLVRRILRKHGYPPDRQERATRTVLEQAEVLSAGWAA